MFPAKLLSFLLAISFGNGASPTPVVNVEESPFTLKFACNLNITGFGNLAEADRARAKVLKSLGLAAAKSGINKRAASFAVTNTVVSITGCTYLSVLLTHGFSLGDLHS